MTAASTTSAPAPARSRTSTGRRIALVAGTVLAGILPTAWGLTSAVDLVTGSEPRSRFYQLTGQGLLLSLVWLGALAPLVVAGWRRRPPPVVAALVHLAVGFGAVVAGALAPGNGGAVVAVVVVVTGAALWAALPVRPALRDVVARVELDPLFAPLGLLSAALLAPYALTEASRQRSRHDEFATMSHYFDMSWVSLTVLALALLVAVFRAARPLAGVVAFALLVLGAAGLGFLHGAAWPVPAVALGVAFVLVGVFRGGGSRPVRRVS
jgi:hypothetical protein